MEDQAREDAIDLLTRDIDEQMADVSVGALVAFGRTVCDPAGTRLIAGDPPIDMVGLLFTYLGEKVELPPPNEAGVREVLAVRDAFMLIWETHESLGRKGPS